MTLFSHSRPTLFDWIVLDAGQENLGQQYSGEPEGMMESTGYSYRSISYLLGKGIMNVMGFEEGLC